MSMVWPSAREVTHRLCLTPKHLSPATWSETSVDAPFGPQALPYESGRWVVFVWAAKWKLDLINHVSIVYHRPCGNLCLLDSIAVGSLSS